MANSTADCHVTAFFEGLLSTKTPRIFVTGYTKIPMSSAKTTTTAENGIQSSPTATKKLITIYPDKMVNRAVEMFVTLEDITEISFGYPSMSRSMKMSVVTRIDGNG